MGWLGDGSHRGQGRQAWTAVGLPPRYPILVSNASSERSFFIAGSTGSTSAHSVGGLWRLCAIQIYVLLT